VTISGSRFEANQVPTNTIAWGGAIMNRGALTVTQTVFDGNTASIGAGLAVSGTASLSSTVFNGNTASFAGGGLFMTSDSKVDLDHGLLTNNKAIRGGGIYNFVSKLTMRDSTLFANQASLSGGGLHHEAYGGAIANSVIKANSASQGGGIYFAVYSLFTLQQVQLIANAASNGAGLFLDVTSEAHLFDSTLARNTGSFGAGISNQGFLTVVRSTLSDNTVSTSGGGIANGNIAELTNSTLSGNTAGSQGGGIYNFGYLTLINATLSNNSAVSAGGALFLNVSGTSALTNTALAYSPSGGNCSGPITSAKYTLSSDNSCALPGLVNGQNPNGLDPRLTALGNYGGPTLVHMLKAGSPAIAGVVGSDAPNQDQRLQPRPGSDGSYDIGAVERQPADSDVAPRLYLPEVVR
jgi:hypothetical protein